MEELENYFKNIENLPEKIELRKGETITDIDKFINSSFAQAKATNNSHMQLAAITNLSRLKNVIEAQKGLKILIIDIETTNFLNNGGKIVEIGIVELNLKNGETQVLFDNVCHEKGITIQQVQNSWIVNNSSLTVELIRQSKELNFYKDEIQEIISLYTNGSTAFNNKFDFGFLEDRGFKFPVKLACPMLLSTNICKIPSKNGHGGYKWPNCEEAYKFFFPESNFIELHRGADDAMHEAQIVQKLYELGHFHI